MKIYQFDDGRTLRSFPTLMEAIAEAKATVTSEFFYGDEIEIEAILVAKMTREVLCDILNGHGGYSSGSVKVKTIRAR